MPVAPGGFESVLCEHEIHTAEHGLFVVGLVHGKGNALDHFGKSLDRDRILREGHLNLGKAITAENGDLVKSLFAFHGELQG